MRANILSTLTTNPMPQNSSLLCLKMWRVRRMIYELVFTQESVIDGNHVMGVNEKHLGEPSNEESSIDARPIVSQVIQAVCNWLHVRYTSRTKTNTDLITGSVHYYYWNHND